MAGVVNLGYLRERILAGAKENREIWLSLTCAWLVLWAAGVYGYQWVLPAIEQNAVQIAAVTEQMGEMRDDIGEVKADVTDVKVIQLETLIFTTRQNQCAANSIESKAFFAQRLSEQLRTYQVLTGQQYRLPACEELE